MFQEGDVIMRELLFLVYIIAGWWAANRTFYANKTLFGIIYAIWTQKFIVAMFLGWILIPIAIIKIMSQK